MKKVELMKKILKFIPLSYFSKIEIEVVSITNKNRLSLHSIAIEYLITQ